MKSIEVIASNPQKWEKLKSKFKEDFFNIARKFNIKIKTKEDLEGEAERERERLKIELLENEKQIQENLDKVKNERMDNIYIEITQIPNKNHSVKINKSKEINNYSDDLINNNTNLIEEKKLKDDIKYNSNKFSIIENVNEIDSKFYQSLIDIFNKKKMSYIPIKKVGENSYVFGTQKIHIKIDEDIIRGLNIKLN